MQIFEGRTGSNRIKRYVVKTDRKTDIVKYAKRFFKCSEKHLCITCGWIYKNELYLEMPKKGGRLVEVAYWV